MSCMCVSRAVRACGSNCVRVSCQEAAAIIAQRADNPREFFRKREKAMASEHDDSPVSIHRTGKAVGGAYKRCGDIGEGWGGANPRQALMSRPSPPTSVGGSNKR